MRKKYDLIITYDVNDLDMVVGYSIFKEYIGDEENVEDERLPYAKCRFVEEVKFINHMLWLYNDYNLIQFVKRY